MRFMKTYRPHRLIPCAATVLILTVATQLKVEHSCSIVVGRSLDVLAKQILSKVAIEITPD